jgi:alcohol dehydrogenase (cytochrome c)
MSGFDEKGRPQRVPGLERSSQTVIVKPTILGATNWYPPSFSPRSGLFYV